ncbi:MAG: cation-translocating P-type ATPase [Oscillospiraceae bacterium]|nr:cation-translocating P-type ATPase [Oscillospiraceae bacterium]
MANKFYSKSIEEVMEFAKTNTEGLATAEAVARLERDGKNELKGTKKVPGWMRFVKQLKHIMMIVLFVAMFLTIVVSVLDPPNQKWVGVGLIALIIVVNASIGFFQENQAEKSVEALKKATKPFAKVMRDGEVISIKTEELVVGDLVFLEAGDIVPADMRLIETASLMIEEAALTGESVPVEKNTDVITGEGLALGDMKNIAFMSGIVTYGRGKAIVIATGMDTQLGIIAGHLANEQTPKTPLTLSLDKTMRIITAIAGLAAAFIFILQAVYRGDSIINSLLLTVAIAVCAIPEAIPICVSVTMSLGVQRMSKRKAIIRNLPAIETLGSTQIICSDKTGTITLNKMTVTATYPERCFCEDDKKRMLDCMVLCNDTHTKYSDTGEVETIGDPTEAALIHYANVLRIKKDVLEEENPRVCELPFDSTRKMMSTLNKTSEGQIMYTKGAFEIIKMRCSHILDEGKIRPMTDEDMARLNEGATGFAKQALRVLGYAYKPFEGDSLTADDENDLIFIGFTGLIDPPREEVIHSVQTCKEAGIITIMITGDHRDTAYAIANQVGIADDESQVVTGAELREMTDSELAEKVLGYRVYARVNPEDKLRIVKSLKSLNKIVAMTGDGVNDAPSIKAADIGIGMGISGTEVTKGAADVILTDDNFATIESAVEEGRRTYSNILKIFVYLVALSIGELILLTTLIAVFDLPFFNPLMILWINVVTDTLPAIAMGSLPAEHDIMKQKPSRTGGSLFRGATGLNIMIHAICQIMAVLTVYLLAMFVFNWDPIIAITMSYVVLGTAETVNPFNLMHFRKSIIHSKPFKSRAVNWAVLVTVILVVGSLLPLDILPLTVLQDTLGITPITLQQWAIAVGAGLMIIPILEVYKFFTRKYYARAEKKEGTLSVS